jgi:hypothetical protein
MGTTYEEQYEKLINYKNEIIVKKPKKSSYSFDNEKYYIKFLNTDFEILKQTYAVTDHKYNTILQQKNIIEKQLQANQKMFLSSRSNFNDDLMRNLYKKYEIVINELNKIKEETNLFILMNETKINNEDEKKTEQKKTKESKTLSSIKKNKIKEFLFKTYEECISQKTSAPTYMSKQQIIDHIMKYEPDILDKLPKSFQNKKKSDICKVIFS